MNVKLAVAAILALICASCTATPPSNSQQQAQEQSSSAVQALQKSWTLINFGAPW